MKATQHPLESIATERHVSPSAKKDSLSQPSENIRRPSLKLSTEDIDHPAMIIDNQLRVAWCNSAAADKIFHFATKANNGSVKPGLFDLLFDTGFRRSVDNWRSWLAFFVEQFRMIVPFENFQHAIEQMAPAKRNIVRPLFDLHAGSPAPVESLSSGTLRQLLTSGDIVTFNLVAADFNIGRLIIFEPIESGKLKNSVYSKHHIEHSIRNVRRYPNPVQLSYCILSAELDRPEVFKLEMLDDAYSAMINAIWKKCISILESYGGVFGKHSDNGFYGYFLPGDAFENQVQPVIECSLDIRSQIAQISREYKLRRSWSHEIALNMGLHRENGFISILGSSSGDIPSSFGKGLRLSTFLSSLAHGGQILATKSFFDRMPPDVMEKLRFGIYRRENGHQRIFMPRGFSDCRELAGKKDLCAALSEPFTGIGVTQVIDIHG